MEKDRDTRYKGLAAEASAWWRRQLDMPKFDNDDSSTVGIIGRGLAQMLAEQNPATPQQLDKFEEELSKIVFECLMEDPHPAEQNAARPRWCDTEEEWQQILAMPRREQCIATDYGPEGFMMPAVEAAGISPDIFPWKTRMWVCWDNRPECCYIKVVEGRQIVRLDGAV